MNILLTLSLLGVVTLFSEIFNFRKLIFPIIIIGLLTAIGFCVSSWNDVEILYNMQSVDNYSRLFTMLLVGITTCWFLLSREYFFEKSSRVDQYALVLFALAGAFVLTSFTNMSMLFIGIEMLSIPVYVLAGSNKNNRFSIEASFKYFMMGAFATGFLLFGIALIYGASGTFDLAKINILITSNSGNVPNIMYAGILLMIIGMCFKIAAVPFHFWAPDVYQGSPTIVTAFMATIVKTAAIAAFYRLFKLTFVGLISSLELILVAIVVLSLLVGNLLAAYQTNVKRLLAYSSVAHAGFLLMGILIIKQTNSDAVIFYYTAAYAVASLITFFVLNTISSTGEDIAAFNGLIKTKPLLAIVMTMALLSLAGIPPLSGFFGKYFMFAGMMSQNYIWVVIVAIFTSLIGVVYYFKIIIAMFAKVAADTVVINMSNLQQLVLLFLAIILLLLGVYPDAILGLF